MAHTLEVVKTNVGDGLTAGHGDWSFSGDVPKTFVSHIQKSVPLYDEGHELICRLSDYFVRPESIVYELGVSTGELTGKLATYNAAKAGARFVGIDVEPSMIEFAKKHCHKQTNVEIIQDDVSAFAYQSCDLIVAYYCIQFIAPRVRQDLVNRLYERLNWGGALVMFEKVRAPDARFQDMGTGLHLDFKADQGYSEEELFAKSRCLRGVLEPFSSQANEDMLRRGGFVDIWPIMKYICFEGVVAIK